MAANVAYYVYISVLVAPHLCTHTQIKERFCIFWAVIDVHEALRAISDYLFIGPSPHSRFTPLT